MKNKKLTSALVFLGIIVVLLLIFGNSMFYIINPGEKGVIFRPYSTGLDKENIEGEGLVIIAPWNDLIIYNVKEQQTAETMDVLDKNGLSLSVDVSIRFNPLYNKIGSLHEIFGVDYINTLVVPELRSSVRKVMGRYTAEEIYSTKRSEVEDAIRNETADILKKNSINMRAMLIRSINLPAEIKKAIENKLKQEQEALAYKFKLEKEKSEAERKRIAAEGEAKANKIINSSLTRELLKMRGIETTLKLAQSENAKIVVIGGGDEGLPLILNN